MVGRDAEGTAGKGEGAWTVWHVVAARHGSLLPRQCYCVGARPRHFSCRPRAEARFRVAERAHVGGVAKAGGGWSGSASNPEALVARGRGIMAADATGGRKWQWRWGRRWRWCLRRWHGGAVAQLGGRALPNPGQAAGSACPLSVVTEARRRLLTVTEATQRLSTKAARPSRASRAKATAVPVELDAGVCHIRHEPAGSSCVVGGLLLRVGVGLAARLRGACVCTGTLANHRRRHGRHAWHRECAGISERCDGRVIDQ
mmetsp:Transcript_12655/g.25485  ORF Transcript_12655/g.25485 Transcript_12655/m.25485 type:complete len:258 (-) Transcript_12655:101-874(-)